MKRKLSERVQELLEEFDSGCRVDNIRLPLCKMDKGLKAKLLRALRSGRYSRTQGRLRRTDIRTGRHSYCCLGLACHLQGVDFNKESVCSLEGERIPINRHAFMPRGMYAGIPLRVQRVLASLNDSGLSFRSIAHIIEHRL